MVDPHTKSTSNCGSQGADTLSLDRTISDRRLGAARGDVGGAGGFTQIIRYCASSPASPRTVPGSWIGWRDHPGGRDVVAGWWAGVMARRGDGGRRGSDHPAWMGEDQVVPASGPGPVVLATNSRTA